MDRHAVLPTVRLLDESEASLIGGIVASAFADDGVNLWTFNGSAAMKPVFTSMARHCFLRYGFGHVTEDGKAGTLWLPPGAPKGYGLWAKMALAWHIVRHGGLKALHHSLALDQALVTQFPSTPHFYLFAIAVDPSLQGTGVGSRLMKEALQEVDKAGMPAYLENSKEQNIAFYVKHGFRVLEKITPAPGCPPMWMMWRDARG